MPERPRKATRPAPKKTVRKASAAVRKSVAPAPRPVPTTPPAAAADVCPRCGTEKFGPEERIRAEGTRTVRYTVLVCERGHTFARPVAASR